MKIVTYNVNGLRPRVLQLGSLRKLLDSLDADIICLQETKLSRHELRGDLVQAEGYESFFSCTRTSDKGRTGYSGVATFCRVNSAFSTTEAALPLFAEEGFTGLLDNFSTSGYHSQLLQHFSAEELLKIDGEGRCIVTHHGHFVLFNIYGPRAHGDDTERIQFKQKFYKILQIRWESLLSEGKSVFVVGDLNIAPTAIDRCDAEPDFEKNDRFIRAIHRFRTWFRSLLVKNGGPFFDVYREMHPDRKDAFTCWPANSGAEVFNFGSRIDHILIAGPCFHDEEENKVHSLPTCHVQDCEILEQFKRWKSGSIPRWKSGENKKLEGSDHVPVCVTLVDIPTVPEHNTPSLSTRYSPQVHGCQQTLVSMFRRQPAKENILSRGCSSVSDDGITVESCSNFLKRPLHRTVSSTAEGACSKVFVKETSTDSSFTGVDRTKSLSVSASKKKTKHSQGSQLSLKMFFNKTVEVNGDIHSTCSDEKINPVDASSSICESNDVLCEGGEIDYKSPLQSGFVEEHDTSQSTEKENKSSAFVEWQRIQLLMQTSIPLCKGHNEPCVSRVVKKSGPNLGRRFYVCARAEGPASNSEANCGFFKWASSKSKHKGCVNALWTST